MNSITETAAIGSLAPAFSAHASQGDINLSQYREQQNVVLYFMRALSCAFCQKHVSALKQMYSELQMNNTAVIVVGAGSQQEAEKLANKLQLPFPLIADTTGDLYARYDLGKALAFIQQSGTFLINTHGTITYMHTATNPSAGLRRDELQAAIQQIQ